MNHLISIIIPVLNRANEIEECIRSVYAQTYDNWEILVIDSGSTDRTPEICRELAAKEPRVRLLTGNLGVSNARNKGLEEARGEYLFFLDSDDVIHPSLLQTLAEAMEAHKAQIAGSGVLNVPNQNWNAFIEKVKADDSIGETKLLTNDKAIYAMFRSTTPINLIGGVMMRRDLVSTTRFNPELHIGEDFYFIYQNMIKGANAVFLKQRWYYARLHKHNLSWDHTFQGFLSRFERRKLVWASEEALGRKENVMLQKRDALDVYLRCLKENHSLNQDTAKMQTTMKAHKKELLPGLSPKQKLLFGLSVNFPGLYLRLFGNRN